MGYNSVADNVGSIFFHLAVVGSMALTCTKSREIPREFALLYPDKRDVITTSSAAMNI